MIENSPNTGHLYERERGQSLVEMAFGLIILVIIFSGLVDLGRAYWTLISMEDAAGEAVMFLSVVPGCETENSAPNGTIGECGNTRNAIYRYRNAPGAQLDWETNGTHNICVNTTSPVNCNNDFGAGIGDTYLIELTYRFDLLTPIIRDLAGDDGITLRVKASQIVVSQPPPVSN